MVLRKDMLRNEKGLTLLELLAVIVILGIIAALATPSIGGIIKNSKERTHYANALMIMDAARFKASDELPTSAVTYTLAELISDDHMDSAPRNPETKKEYAKGAKGNPESGTRIIVTVDGNGNYGYTIVLVAGDGTTIGEWKEEELKQGKIKGKTK